MALKAKIKEKKSQEWGKQWDRKWRKGTQQRNLVQWHHSHCIKEPYSTHIPIMALAFLSSSSVSSITAPHRSPRGPPAPREFSSMPTLVICSPVWWWRATDSGLTLGHLLKTPLLFFLFLPYPCRHSWARFFLFQCPLLFTFPFIHSSLTNAIEQRWDTHMLSNMLQMSIVISFANLSIRQSTPMAIDVTGMMVEGVMKLVCHWESRVEHYSMEQGRLMFWRQKNGDSLRIPPSLMPWLKFKLLGLHKNSKVDTLTRQNQRRIQSRSDPCTFCRVGDTVHGKCRGYRKVEGRRG